MNSHFRPVKLTFKNIFLGQISTEKDSFSRRKSSNLQKIDNVKILDEIKTARLETHNQISLKKTVKQRKSMVYLIT